LRLVCAVLISIAVAPRYWSGDQLDGISSLRLHVPSLGGEREAITTLGSNEDELQRDAATHDARQ
jgi:hypothetical protein